MLVQGDKLMVTKKVASFLDVGEVVEVIDVNEDGMISFMFGNGMHKGLMNSAECEAHFEKIEDKKTAPTITQDYIDNIIANSVVTVDTVFDKCTIVSCKLPNGFVIVESSACVSPENYDEDMGINICLSKIEDKIWELEGYRLQCELNGDCGCCCDDCDCDDEYDDEDEDEVECFDYDLDCDDCDDYDCPYNTRS